MDLATIKKMMRNQWNAESDNIRTWPLSGEAKFVTGMILRDKQLHYLETVAGLELILSEDFKDILGYNVIDSQKFTWFVVKWS